MQPCAPMMKSTQPLGVEAVAAELKQVLKELTELVQPSAKQCEKFANKLHLMQKQLLMFASHTDRSSPKHFWDLLKEALKGDIGHEKKPSAWYRGEQAVTLYAIPIADALDKFKRFKMAKGMLVGFRLAKHKGADNMATLRVSLRQEDRDVYTKRHVLEQGETDFVFAGPRQTAIPCGLAQDWHVQLHAVGDVELIVSPDEPPGLAMDGAWLQENAVCWLQYLMDGSISRRKCRPSEGTELVRLGRTPDDGGSSYDDESDEEEADELKEKMSRCPWGPGPHVVIS